MTATCLRLACSCSTPYTHSMRIPEITAQLRRQFRYIFVRRISRHEYRANRIVVAACRWPSQYRGGGRSCPGYLPISAARRSEASLRSWSGLPGRPRETDPQPRGYHVQPLVDNYRSTCAHYAYREPSFGIHRAVSTGAAKKEFLVVSQARRREGSARRVPASSDERSSLDRRWKSSGCTAPGQPVGVQVAALYRIHSHRDELVEALEERGIPFVIRNLSILNHPLVRDLIAYVRLLANPGDNIACARVLAAPAWGLQLGRSGWQPAAEASRQSKETSLG